MLPTFKHVSVVSLFVEELGAAKRFYQEVFAAPVVFEDENSAVLQFDNLMINLLQVREAPEIIAPGPVAPREAGSRFQFSVWVPDVEAVCAVLRERGVELNGPINRPWGMRTANFFDPAGHSWEVAQQIG